MNMYNSYYPINSTIKYNQQQLHLFFRNYLYIKENSNKKMALDNSYK